MYIGNVGGRFKARRMPVTTAEKSEIVFSRLITFRERNSKTTQLNTETMIMTTERTPNMNPAATDAGSRAMTTSLMMDAVVALSRMWGELDTCNFICLCRQDKLILSRMAGCLAPPFPKMPFVKRPEAFAPERNAPSRRGSVFYRL